MATETKREYVRKRHDNNGSLLRPRKIEIRMSEPSSNRLASIQGLLYRFGGRKTMAELFESIMLPALEEYVRPYVEKAKAERESGESA